MTNTSFTNWLTARYTDMASQYRQELHWICATVAGYCSEGQRLNEGQAAAMLELLAQVKRPELGKFPGEATQADRDYYTNARKPDFAGMLEHSQQQIKSLCIVT